MHLILNIIFGAELCTAGVALGYLWAKVRTRKQMAAHFEDLAESFNDLLEDLYQHTGYELPKLPVRKDKS